MDNLLIENLLFSAVLYGSLRLKQKWRCIDELHVTVHCTAW